MEKGEHLKNKEVKSRILEFILEKDNQVSEPDIRDFLKEKYNVIDQSTINKHLHALKDLNCIEQMPKKKGSRNHWDIMKKENLRNIHHEFPTLRVNKYEKALGIVIQPIFSDSFRLNLKKLYAYMLISPSLFYTYLEMEDNKLFFTGFENLFYKRVEPLRHQRIERLLKVCYTACIKYFPEFETDEHTFDSYMKYNDWNFVRRKPEEKVRFIRACFSGLPDEIDTKILENRLTNLEKIPEKIQDEIRKEDFVKYMLNTIRLIVEEYCDFEFSRDKLLFEHFYDHDVLTGKETDIELYYLEKIQENYNRFKGTVEDYDLHENQMNEASIDLINEMLSNNG